jgi:alcohol dehydrogenase (cytochrome c)
MGWRIEAERMQGAFDAFFDKKTSVPQSGTLLVFQLKS